MSSRSSCVLFNAILLTFFGFLSTAAGQESGKLVDLLRERIEAADAEVNIFLNDRRVEMYERRVEEETDPVQKIIRRAYLPVEYLRAGMTRQCLEETHQLQQLAQEWDTPEDLQIMRDLRVTLALGYLRLGEQTNCILNHSADSCLFPIRGAGIHQDQTGSRMAIRLYSDLLEENPSNLTYRWLLNLAHMTVDQYPSEVPERWLIPPASFASDHRIPQFPDVAPATKLDVVGVAGGSILEDFDRDGWIDVMASSYYISDQLQYFHSNGDGTFDDWTERAGLEGQLGGLNMIQGDYNNDGFMDVYILRGAWFSILENGAGNYPNSLLRNNGDGTFTDVTIEAGLLDFQPSHSAVFVDYDLDGHLDLFIANESVASEIHPCRLMRNNGDGTFTDVAPEVGLDHVGFVKAAAWGDYDNDRDPDLYLSRFQQSNLLFRNDGPQPEGWSFTEVSREAGVGAPVPSFPAWFWDFDNDGWEDLFVASFSAYLENTLPSVVEEYLGESTAEHSRLYRNRRDGTFEDVTSEMGLDIVLMTMGANFGDLDNDGYLDAYIGTGQPAMDTLIPNRLFRNDAGKRFQDVTTAAGVGHLQKGHGISFADLDNDGDQDIYAVMGGAYSGDTYQNALFENPGGWGNRWITLRLKGEKSNRTAVGARIKITILEDGEKRAVHVTVSTGGSFGESSIQQEIGLGKAESIDCVEVRWPNRERTVQSFEGLELDQVYELQEGETEARRVSVKGFQLPRAAGGDSHHGGGTP